MYLKRSAIDIQHKNALYIIHMKVAGVIKIDEKEQEIDCDVFETLKSRDMFGNI